MFGIGLPELIVILGIALIVVGPERLPEMAKSLAKGINELKKTAAALKETMDEELKKEEESDTPHQNLNTAPPEFPGINPPPAQSDDPEAKPEAAASDAVPPPAAEPVAPVDTTPSIPESAAPPSSKP